MPITLKKREITCPFCFKRYPASDVHFRCANVNESECAKEEDQILSRHRSIGLPTPLKLRMRRVIEPQGNGGLRRRFVMPLSAHCSACEFPTSDRLCPACHEDLPYVAGHLDDCTLGVIGTAAAGKSHYIATLVHQVKNRVGLAFDTTLQALDDETRRRFRQEFYNPLYVGGQDGRKEAIKKTQKVNRPLVFRLDAHGKRSKRKDQAITLSFYDAAGEIFASDENIKGMAGDYLKRARGLIFLIDPLQIPAIRDELAERFRKDGLSLPDINDNPEDILGRFIRFYQEKRRDVKSKIDDVPLAVVLAKYDLLQQLELDWNLDSPVWQDQLHDDGCFNAAAHSQISAHVQAVLNQRSGVAFDRLLANAFKNYSYFAVTALGGNPDRENKLHAVNSWRVEDPFLWMLAQLNVIPTRNAG